MIKIIEEGIHIIWYSSLLIKKTHTARIEENQSQKKEIAKLSIVCRKYCEKSRTFS